MDATVQVDGGQGWWYNSSRARMVLVVTSGNHHLETPQQMHQTSFEKGIELEEVGFEHYLCGICFPGVRGNGEVEAADNVVGFLG